MLNSTMADFYNEKLLAILPDKLNELQDLCDQINDGCDGILDGNLDQFNTVQTAKEMKELCTTMQKIINQLNQKDE